MGRGGPPPTAGLLRFGRDGFGHGRAGNNHNFGRSWPWNRNADHFGRGRAGDWNPDHFGRGGFNGRIGGFLLAPGSREQRAGQSSDHGSFTHISPLMDGTEWAVWRNAAGGDLFPRGVGGAQRRSSPNRGGGPPAWVVEGHAPPYPTHRDTPTAPRKRSA